MRARTRTPGLLLVALLALAPAIVAASDESDQPWREQLRLEGIPPFSLTIKNDTRLQSLEQLESYRETRHESLAALADDDPGRMIVVAVAPDALRTIPEFLADLDCGCKPRLIVSDIWSGEQWIMERGGGYLRPDRLQAAEERRARAGRTKTVRSMRIRLPASDALALTKADHVLLVDPLTEVRDRHRWMALRVEVANAPDVFSEYMRYELGMDATP